MKRLFCTLSLAMLIGVVGIVTTGCAAARGQRVLGDWEMHTTFGGGEIDAVMKISAQGGQLVGVWSSQGREMEMTNVKVSGNTLTFQRTIPGGEELRFEGEISNDSIDGAYHGALGNLKCKGARVQAD